MNFKVERWQDFALLFMRIVVAVIFLYSTYGKWSYLSAGLLEGVFFYLTWFLMIVEPLGAVALLAGFLTRWAAAGLAIIMVGAVVILRFMMNAAVFTSQAPGLDYNLLILAGCIVLVAFGAGRYSYDAWKR